MKKEIMTQITTNSRIVCGDCLELIKRLPNDCMDLILTGSPYNLGLFMRKRGTNIKSMRKVE